MQVSELAVAMVYDALCTMATFLFEPRRNNHDDLHLNPQDHVASCQAGLYSGHQGIHGRTSAPSDHPHQEGLTMCRRADIEAKILMNIRQGSHSGTGRGGGYPRMSLDGQTVAVHIVAFTNKNGFVPGKKQIDHKCNTRMCVNPDHLQMVTHKKNQKLRIQRSRKETNVVSLEHFKLQSTHAPSDDRGRDEVPELGRVPEDEESLFEESYDGRYLPDHAFWETPAHLRA
jgi:hypothetical protein